MKITIKRVSRNKRLVFFTFLNKYNTISFILMGALAFLISSIVLMFIVLGIAIVGGLIYVAPFFTSKKEFEYTLVLENGKVILQKGDYFVDEYVDIISVSINSSEYKGQQIGTSLYTSYGLNKIAIKTKENNYRFVFRTISRQEKAVLDSEIEQFSENSIYKIYLKSNYFSL